MRNEPLFDVVIVDEDEQYLRRICRDIGALGYLAEGVKDASSACSIISFHKPSLAVIDMEISGKGALWLASCLTSLNPRQQIVFTASQPEKLNLATRSSLPSLSRLLKPLDHTNFLPILEALTQGRPRHTHFHNGTQPHVKVA